MLWLHNRQVHIQDLWNHACYVEGQRYFLTTEQLVENLKNNFSHIANGETRPINGSSVASVTTANPLTPSRMARMIDKVTQSHVQDHAWMT